MDLNIKNWHTEKFSANKNSLVVIGALTLTLNTFTLKKSTLRRFGKIHYNTYPIIQSSASTPYVRPLTLPIPSELARFHFDDRTYHLCKSLFPALKNLLYFSTLWKRRTNNEPLTMYIKNRRNSSKIKVLGSYQALGLAESFILRNCLLFIYCRYGQFENDQ